MTQVYIPATLAMLQRLVADGALWPVNGTAFAVTPTLRESYAEGDDEELAEVALREAALASLRLLAAVVGGILSLLLAPLFPMTVVVPLSAFVALPAIATVIGLLASVAGLRRVVAIDPALAFGGP